MKHETIVSGVRLDGAERGVVAPTILRFTEPDFVKVFLAELRRPDWQAAIAARRVLPGTDGAALVEQPVHRAFHLALVDARCLVPGLPRLDALKVISAGVVLRRQRRGVVEGWMRDGAAALGWRALPAGALDQNSRYEPDAALRLQQIKGRNGAVLAGLDRLPGQAALLTEDSAPLFAVPPDIATATGASLYYGFLPVISGETEPQLGPPPAPFALKDILLRVPALLRADRAGVVLPPVAGDVARAEMLQPENAADITRGAGIRVLKSALVWLAQETGAFTGGPEVQPIRDCLNQITLAGVTPNRLFDWFDLAQKSLLTAEAGAPDPLRMPDGWPQLTGAQMDMLAQAALAAMTARWSKVAPLTPRYPASRAVYEMRCFLRVDDCPDGCPPRVAWSPPLRSLRIKPWYDGADSPPIQIELPALTADALRAVKPNVSFKVPPELQQHLDRIDLQNLLDGKHTKTSLGFGMICSFSIPIITICAFFILQIFLGLLNIVFQWLFFVRICLPYPKIETEEEGG